VKEPIDPASLLPGMCQVNKSWSYWIL
jgi:hypothetical protein